MTNFQTAQIFSDNMVLQFQKPVSVFGTGTDGTKITVSISGMEAATNSTVCLLYTSPSPRDRG